MEGLVAIFVIVGLGLLIRLTAQALYDRSASAPPIEDRAVPYREGLHTAIRLQRVAEDLEREIYAEAARHMDAAATRQIAARAGEKT